MAHRFWYGSKGDGQLAGGVIGIPLPFFSYGGSSLWGFTILLAIMLRLDAARVNKMQG